MLRRTQNDNELVDVCSSGFGGTGNDVMINLNDIMNSLYISLTRYALDKQS